MNMSINELLNLQSVAVRTYAYNLNAGGNKEMGAEGSGVLIYYNRGWYVLTAGHCVCDRDFLQVEIRLNKDNFKNLNVSDRSNSCYDEDKQIDYAIIKLDDVTVDRSMAHTLRLVNVEDEKDKDNREGLGYLVSGYPSLDRQGMTFDVEYKDSDTWHFIDVKPSMYKTFRETIEGISGSGVMRFVGNELHCAGILKRCLDEDGSMNCIKAHDSHFFMKQLEEYAGSPFKTRSNPTDISDNQDYIERYCSHFDPTDSLRFLLDAEERYTLFDYVEGRVAGVLSNRFVLTADPQTGKSYEMRHLARVLSDNLFHVVFVEAKDAEDGIVEMLPQGDTLKERKLALVVDAIDESKCLVSTNLDAIKEFSRNNPEVLVVVSCRNGFDVEKRLSAFTHLYLMPMTYADVDNVLQGLDAPVKDGVLAFFSKTDNREFLTSPFFLKTIVAYVRQGKQLPNSTSALYDLYVGDSGNPSRRLWQEIAIVMIFSNRHYLTGAEIDRLASETGSSEKIYDKMILQKTTMGYSFVNNAIKEFLAAEYLLLLPFDKVKQLVCHLGTEEIKKQWYNVLVLWLQKKTSEGKHLDGEVLQWMKDNGRQLLLYADTKGIPEATRVEIAKAVLDSCKETNTFYSSYYLQDFERLFHFANCLSFIDYLAYELEHIQPSPHAYNVICLVKCVEWQILEQYASNLYKRLVDALFGLVERFGDTDRGDAVFFPFIFGNAAHYYRNQGMVERMMGIARNFTHYNALNALASFLYKANACDEYCDWLLDKEPLIKDDGYTIVSRSYICQAMGSTKKLKNIRNVLLRVTESRFVRHERDTDEYVSMTASLLSSLLCSTEGSLEERVTIAEEAFFKMYGEYYHLNVQRKTYKEYKTFFENTILSEKVNERCAQIENFGKIPQEVLEESQRRWQREYDEMTDYQLFCDSVRRVLNGIEGEEKEFLSITGTNRWIMEFLSFYSDLKFVHKAKIETVLNDEAEYCRFRMYCISEVMMGKAAYIQYSEGQKKCCIETANEIISMIVSGKTERLLWQYSQMAVKQVILGNIELSVEQWRVLLTLYSHEYAHVENVANGNTEEPETLLQRFCQSFDSSQAIQVVSELVEQNGLSEPAILSFSGYLIENGTKEVCEKVYDMMMSRKGSGLSDVILGNMLNREDYAPQLVADFEKFTDSQKIDIASKMKDNKDFADELLSRLEDAFDGFNSFNKKRAIHVMFSMGSMKALKYAADNKKEVFANGEFFILNYSDPQALPLLSDLLSYTLCLDGIFQTVTNSILISMGNIAVSSEENFQNVEQSIGQIIKTNPQKFGFLHNSILVIREQYLQAKDKMWSVEDAMEIVEKSRE
ncbi:MAG: trypsin-like serine protease [Prevotellaceae bacterium]|nr:trypsin-like serine protease [Prevotellaceae bacterium]